MPDYTYPQTLSSFAISMTTSNKESRFLAELELLFTGAEVEGESGFINLMQIKREYFKSILPKLMEAVDERAGSDTSFREELFDKLYTFFSRYFCESGSIYFCELPAFQSVYDRVYADGQDVVLAWKTRRLYYVKSDILIRSMPVTLESDQRGVERCFYFDASKIENKKYSEKRNFLYEFKHVENAKTGPVMHLQASYAVRGRKTNVAAIIKATKSASKIQMSVNEADLRKAIQVFERQTETDYFIHMDARGFLREQFDLWLYQYMFQEENIFEGERLGQLQAIQKTAYDIIDFIAQFEDELRRIWEKPKFVRNVNYVVTLDKLSQKLLKKIAKHPGASKQTQEWIDLGMVSQDFKLINFVNCSFQFGDDDGDLINDAYKYLPLDTKYFKELEIDILGEQGNLDESLDGELVHSENWQALNTLRKRFKGRVNCIYIDPPYNTGASEIVYKNGYKNSAWLTMMENRISLGKEFLNSSGAQCTTIDDFQFHRLREIIASTYGESNIAGIFVIKSNPSGRSTAKGISIAHEYGIVATASDKSTIGRLPRTQQQISRYDESDEIGPYEWVNFRKHGGIRAEASRMYYPVYCSERGIRVPDLHWSESAKEWIATENPRSDEEIVYPIDDNGRERRWKWAKNRLVENLVDVSVKKDKNGKPNIYIKSRLPGEGVLPSTWWDKSEYSATAHGTNLLKNIMGELRTFDYPKSLYAVRNAISVCSPNPEGAVLDFFAGSGTTAHAVIDLNRENGSRRKYVLVEMGEHFHTVLLPRIKKVVYSKDWKNGKPTSLTGISQFFKYYTLEQYEDTLRNARFTDGKQLTIDSMKSPFEQYVFFGDTKMAHAVEQLKNRQVDVNLQRMYHDLDFAESLSNILGKPIQHRSRKSVTFVDGTIEKIDPAYMTDNEKLHFVSLIHPMLWWGDY